MLWQPLSATTLDETVFLAPLDIVSARGRARHLFDSDYVWEVYKPLEQRRWGYYVLPVLYDDRLVARLDPKLDRAAATLRIDGFWLEDYAPGDTPEFATALSRGLYRFSVFLNARRIDIKNLTPASLRTRVQKQLNDVL